MVIAANSHLRHHHRLQTGNSVRSLVSLAQDKTVDTLTIEVIPKSFIISLAAQIPKQVKKLEV